ncbi:uncharacterized protein L969DRAFT_43983 [Mixia osmundae IAM 14324]|uniref:Uncharacterized protein n=1 Tax=Mixia osmundae (strain CBS 9802 / IAM 14324 / JCM 22182 / KY 12970) TaxID=764103 RepID=G7DX80_MIXOS|nr:uncharacterized protein L969DRAFT_43983 [Mixia osmundae IAM 14324]KEI42647.1 hypothetical protein L969DRAFT_43983 [Mixia osmundae IAM 14324]GAA95190.1 hypothetical protein E5Q_01845 [Mixia osmundae IAM 14324]
MADLHNPTVIILLPLSGLQAIGYGLERVCLGREPANEQIEIDDARTGGSPTAHGASSQRKHARSVGVATGEERAPILLPNLARPAFDGGETLAAR